MTKQNFHPIILFVGGAGAGGAGGAGRDCKSVPKENCEQVSMLKNFFFFLADPPIK